METINRTAPLDYLCIGLGPFNLSFACMAAPIEGLNGRVLEQSSEFNWHPNMLIDGTTLQNPFLADLVSMADPTSPFSYLNYCKQQGRLYQFYIREKYYLSRAEYNRYCRWAVDQLDTIKFCHTVTDISYLSHYECYVVRGCQTLADDSVQPFQYFTKKLIIGVGSLPQFPASVAHQVQQLKANTPQRLLHTSDYLRHKEALKECQEITVIGSGQSGAEVFYDLLSDSAEHQYRLNWVTRSPRYFQMETAKLTLELITPDYAEYFYDLSPRVKNQVLKDHKSLYQGINASLIDQIYDALDDNHHSQACEVRLLPNLELLDIAMAPSNETFRLRFKHHQDQAEYSHQTHAVVFASGYGPKLPSFIHGIKDRIQWDDNGDYQPNRNWSVDLCGNEIFVQNAGLQGHGITNPDIGMACYRNGRILHAITGVDYYPAEANTSFQTHQPNNDSSFKKITVSTNTDSTLHTTAHLTDTMETA
ncbi:lysine N(6)-hydroxylase/L-ornithine N(5)-oxygenase family protein [Rhodanobacter aciditrophus]|uniref:Lysine N(6)-hydroxylase/L-ornithine N(5)-oxygenase family protein n=1 Tax=Rhodanobacter aciditrophus TaxID=1623218 RepID=A0ABW4B134_9GAMM